MMFLTFAFAAIELISPVKEEVVTLIPDCQRAALTNETRVARVAALDATAPDGKAWRKHDAWRQARATTFTWRATAGENNPWEFAVARNADFSDARIEFVKTETNAEGIVKYTLPRANFEIAAKYHWRVRSGKTCAVGSFVTEDLAPRWIAIEGRVGNFRDLGGRIGLDGRRVRQGMIYRSKGLNDNSVCGKRKGRNRLMVEDVEYLTKVLGIKTDLDLRTRRETANMTTSPLGPEIRFIHHPSACYAGIFTEHGKERMASNFRVFCDRKNYPIIFHCIGGADRTGSLGYVLNGVLGVSRKELETDWESTFYPRIPWGDNEGKPSKRHKPGWRSEHHFNDGFGKFGDANSTWNERIVLYLKSCGITDAEIETFRSIMLER